MRFEVKEFLRYFSSTFYTALLRNNPLDSEMPHTYLALHYTHIGRIISSWFFYNSHIIRVEIWQNKLERPPIIVRYDKNQRLRNIFFVRLAGELLARSIDQSLSRLYTYIYIYLSTMLCEHKNQGERVVDGRCVNPNQEICFFCYKINLAPGFWWWSHTGRRCE